MTPNFFHSAIFTMGNEGKLLPQGLVKKICGVDIPPLLVGDPAHPLLPWDIPETRLPKTRKNSITTSAMHEQ